MNGCTRTEILISKRRTVRLEEKQTSVHIFAPLTVVFIYVKNLWEEHIAEFCLYGRKDNRKHSFAALSTLFPGPYVHIRRKRKRRWQSLCSRVRRETRVSCEEKSSFRMICCRVFRWFLPRDWRASARSLGEHRCCQDKWGGKCKTIRAENK